jgi:nucleoside-diphosphate-sugar epimerase
MAAAHVFLVTGATGAIGQAVLPMLAARGDVEQLHALTHVAPLGAGPSRVVPVGGDVTGGSDLGMQADTAAALRRVVTGIVHLAADTRFAASLDELRRTNVDGVKNVLAFARRCSAIDRVLVLSTTHVAGRRSGVILEPDLEHDAGFVNPYEASKYEAEQVLRSELGRLPIAVCRLSTVIGDSVSGEIARRGAIHHAVLALYAGLAPMVPGREDSPVDLLALDEAAKAIALLATEQFRAGERWHLCAGRDTVAAGELIDLTMRAIHEYRPSWRRRAVERPAFVDLETFDLFQRSVDRVGDAAMRAATAIVSQFAPQLAFPKRFDDSRCRAALSIAGVSRAPVRDVWTQVVKRLVQPRTATISGMLDAGERIGQE